MGRFLGRSRYRQISFFFALMLTLFFVSIVGFRIVLLGRFSHDHLRGDAVTFLVFSIPFWLLLILPETKRAHIAQILVLIAFGSVAVFHIAPRDLGGDLAFVLAGALAYRYGLLDSRRTLKLTLIMGTLVLLRLGAVLYYDEIDINRAINQIIIVVFSVPFLYLIFERDFLRTVKEKEQLQSDREKNRPFVEFGRNVSGIVHDFKNDLSLFSSFAEFLKACEWEPLKPGHVRQLEGYVDRFRRRIERLLFVTRKRGLREDETFSLEEAVRSALYVFETATEFRRAITFRCRCSAGDTLIHSRPDELLSILENLIRNSCEALLRSIESRGVAPYETPRIDLGIEPVHDRSGVLVVIEDNGPGFPAGGTVDGEEYRLDLRSPVRKSDGSIGLGLRNVALAAETIGARVVLRSARDRGVRAEVLLPASVIRGVEIDG